MEKKMENCMEAGMIGLIVGILGAGFSHYSDLI